MKSKISHIKQGLLGAVLLVAPCMVNAYNNACVGPNASHANSSSNRLERAIALICSLADAQGHLVQSPQKTVEDLKHLLHGDAEYAELHQLLCAIPVHSNRAVL